MIENVYTLRSDEHVTVRVTLRAHYFLGLWWSRRGVFRSEFALQAHWNHLVDSGQL